MVKKLKKVFSFSGQQLFFLISTVLIIFFLLLDSTGILLPLRKGVSFLFEPVSVDASQLGGNVKEYVGIITQVSKFKKEYNDMKIEMYEKDVNNAYYLSLLKEKESLEKQLNLTVKDKKYLSAKVMGNVDVTMLNINVGSKDGVKKGDVVSLGNMFVGLVEVVDEYGSLVVLPYSKSSSLEVFITPVGVENGVVLENVKVLSKAVIMGMGDRINIENISVNVDVKEGDVVVTNDSKVGGYVVVGKLVNLSSNPAETSRSATVVPLVDYSDLMTVFVNID
ncbi:MAG: rod shape-determining protein MreC [Candidatus Dojkabacteria bacterium]